MVRKLESAYGRQNCLLFEFASLERIRKESIGIEGAKRMEYIQCLLSDGHAAIGFKNRDCAEHVCAKEPHAKLLGIVDNLKAEKHGRREAVQRAPAHMTSHGEGIMIEHFGAGIGSERDELVCRLDRNLETRRVFRRPTMCETREWPVHGKAKI